MLSKRQLPSWMMKKVAASNVNNSENVAETDCSKENGDNIIANATKKGEKKETSRSKSNLNAKREVKRRRNVDQQDGSDDNVTPKKKKKGNRSRDRVSRSSKKKDQNLEDLSHGNDDDVYQVQVSGDDDMELTVEDLVAIAEQYVKDHESKERQETTKQCESNWQFPASTETGTTRGSRCENERSSSSEGDFLYNSAPTTGELIGTSSFHTDHPALDMLDVFLGPLFRSTLEKEEKSKSTQESLEITHEFTRQS